jgi:hypothetical protein
MVEGFNEFVLSEVEVGYVGKVFCGNDFFKRS